ncbi:microsomal glutathione S-transferase 3 [Senna tora]|uniref:Glutathione S-transferase 3, mitochondrial n=1 Tax=Senna tora TaxID=362788 RepID=A0A834T8V2_9FABA|nr:microsomal glutathione S-transferase 3 [Senna tora]
MAGIVELLPREYGYVVIVLVLYCFLNVFMAIKVGMARRKYKVFYPTLYASESENKDAKLFNCVQRGHQNSLENMPMFFMLMILGGLKHPCISASLGSLYIVCRYFYFTGYSSGIPDNRNKIGKYGSLALLGLLICTISLGYSLLQQPASV